MNLRKEWFAFVKKIRSREKKKQKKDVSHREAMAIASTLWPKEKAKIARRLKREAKKAQKSNEVLPSNVENEEQTV